MAVSMASSSMYTVRITCKCLAECPKPSVLTRIPEYLDSDNSGTHTECVTDNISTAFSPLADWLRTNKRQAINSETGGGNTASCQKYLCQQLQFLK
jgi:endoglucanase